MSVRHSYPVVLVVAVLIAAASCSHRGEYSEFRRITQRDSLGRYAFTLDLSDSLSSYDISFYTRLDSKRAVFRNMDDISVEVTLQSPSGLLYQETVYIPKMSSTSSTAFSKQYFMPYRTDAVPVLYGSWKMFLYVPSDMQTGLLGMGVCVNPKKL